MDSIVESFTWMGEGDGIRLQRPAPESLDAEALSLGDRGLIPRASKARSP